MIQVLLVGGNAQIGDDFAHAQGLFGLNLIWTTK
jgi:hypothetical protein